MKEITILLARDGIVREVTAEELAAEIGVATVRPALVALWLRPGESQAAPIPASPNEGGGKGEGARSIDGSGTQDRSIGRSQENISVRSDRSNEGTQEYILSENDRSFPGKLEASLRDPGVLAKRLADELHDPGGFSWYQTLTATLDPEVILSALARSLRIPSSKIRTTRGAYFTSIVTPLYREARERRLPAPV